MNRKATAIAATLIGLASLTACNPVEVVDYVDRIQTDPIIDVGTPPVPGPTPLYVFQNCPEALNVHPNLAVIAWDCPWLLIPAALATTRS